MAGKKRGPPSDFLLATSYERCLMNCRVCSMPPQQASSECGCGPLPPRDIETNSPVGMNARSRDRVSVACAFMPSRKMMIDRDHMRLRYALVLAAGLAAGCSGGGDDLPRESVSGTVTLDSQPLADGVIQFMPAGDGGRARPRAAVGEVGSGALRSRAAVSPSPATRDWFPASTTWPSTRPRRASRPSRSKSAGGSRCPRN